MSSYVISAAVALVALILTWVVTGRASRRVWLSDAVTGRSNHSRPTSRAGGAIFVGVSILALCFLTVQGIIPPQMIMIAAILVAMLGLIDDLRSIPASLKLIVLSITGAVVSYTLGGVPDVPPILPGGGWLELTTWTGVVLGALFFVGFVNALNFMDGLNGVAGSTAIIGLATLAILAGSAGFTTFVTCLIIAAATYGFLMRNVGGGVFMGDAGSLGMGAALSILLLQAGHREAAAFYVGLAVFLPFLADTSITFMKRFARGANVLEAHKEHYYQRLREVGFSHQAVALLYVGFSVFCLASVWLGAMVVGAPGVWFGGLIGLAAYVSAIHLLLKRA